MDRVLMLKRLGLSSEDDLFSDVPKSVRKDLDLPLGMSEMETVNRMTEMLSNNRTASDMPCFMGMGSYRHYVPAVVDHITGLSELYTSYTPYQPEISQGMLQALFEYQSLICELTGMDVANSSMYDCATALGEAARMCSRISEEGNIFLIPEALSSERKRTLENYIIGTNMVIKRYGFDRKTGCADMEQIEKVVSAGGVCGMYAEMPNLFGCLDRNIASIKKMLGKVPFVVGVNPMCLGVVKAPGDMGADIVIGEGQPLGTRMGFGGPLLGMFACRQEHVRKMPGRVIGMTQDSKGETAFCLTLQTREQHIRRSSAASNICSNEALTAVAAAVYLSYMGADGMTDIARRNFERADRLMDLLSDVEGIHVPVFDSRCFNEFTVRMSLGPGLVNRKLLTKGVMGGVPLKGHVSGFDDCMLIATTEMHSDEDQDKLVNALKEVL